MFQIPSDTSALVQVTQRVVYLEDGDCAELTLDGVRVSDSGGKAVSRQVHVSQLTADAVELGHYRHYMQKEIFEQPMAVANTLEMVTGAQSVSPQLFGAEAERIFRDVDSVLILACGTSYHAGMVARYWLEALAGIPCSVEIASEYRYRESVPNPKGLVITVSQSGETADTIAALQYAKSLGHRYALSICNVPESSLVRASHLRFLTRAGPESAVRTSSAVSSMTLPFDPARRALRPNLSSSKLDAALPVSSTLSTGASLRICSESSPSLSWIGP